MCVSVIGISFEETPISLHAVLTRAEIGTIIGEGGEGRRKGGRVGFSAVCVRAIMNLTFPHAALALISSNTEIGIRGKTSRAHGSSQVKNWNQKVSEKVGYMHSHGCMAISQRLLWQQLVYSERAHWAYNIV